MIKLEILGKPVPWSAPRKGKNGFYAPHGKSQEQAKWQIKSQFNQEIFTGPVYLDAIFFFCPPKSTPKAKRRQMLEGRMHHIFRPDRSNCLKFAEDVCTGIVWEDDSQVVSGRCQKLYGEIPKTVLIIEKIDVFARGNIG